MGRIRTNLTYFRVNYMLISMSTVLVFFLAKPSAIVWLLLLLAVVFPASLSWSSVASNQGWVSLIEDFRKYSTYRAMVVW